MEQVGGNAFTGRASFKEYAEALAFKADQMFSTEGVVYEQSITAAPISPSFSYAADPVQEQPEAVTEASIEDQDMQSDFKFTV